MSRDELPAGLLFRRPGLGDAESVAALMCLVDLAEIGEAETDANDVRDDWGLPRFDLARDAWLVVDEAGELHAYGWVWDKRPDQEMIGDIYAKPGPAQPAQAAALCQVIEERAREHVSAARLDEDVVLGFFAPVGSEWAAFLEGRGYPTVRTYYRMEIELGGEPPVRPEIAGVEVREFRPGVDDSAIHQVLQESFSDHHLFSAEPLEEWMERRRAHAVADPSLWRLAWDGSAPAGGILAYPFEGMAWIRELGVRRDWRSRGIGRALLLHSFADLHARGHRRVGLGVDAQNVTGATRLYESAGMRVTLRHEFHVKVLRAARTSGNSTSGRPS